MPSRYVTLGRIAGVYGVKGWVKVQSFTRPPENILDYPQWYIATSQGFESKLLEGRLHSGTLIASISGHDGARIDDREVAAGLIGAEVQVERTKLPKAEEGTWYWTDLVGLEVESTRGEKLGCVTAMTDNGAQDVLVIGEGGERRLIPFVIGPIVQSVEVASGRIVVDWSPDW